MSDTTELFIVLGAIYLAECVLRAPRSAVAFLPGLWSGWRILPGTRFYGNTRWGLFLTNPIPDRGAALVCELWPISIGPAGLYSYVSQAFCPGERHEQKPRFVRFEELRSSAAAGSDVLINGERFVTTASPRLAARLSELILRIKRLHLKKRARAIEAALAESLDLPSVEARIREFEAAVSWLSTAALGMFIHLFVVCPLVAWRYGFELTWLYLLGTLLVLDLALLVLFYRAHRLLLPQWTSDRWSHLATMLLLPLATMRGPAALARHLVADFHPLAVAQALCSPSCFQEFAAALVRDLCHPIQPACASEDPDVIETEQYFRSRLLAASESFIGRAGTRWQDLTAGPPRDGEDHQSYCPRCHCQFLIPTGQCQSCNLPLVPWETTDPHACSA